MNEPSRASGPARDAGGPPARLVAAAVLLGAALRLAAVFATPVFPIVANTWDSTFYHETAGALARDEGFSFQGKPTAFFPPAYPAALSLAYRALGDDPRSGQLLNALISMALAFAAAWGMRSLTGPRAGRWTLVVMALEPSQIVMPAFLMSEVACAAALAFFAGALLRREGRPGWGGTLLAALAAVAAGMTRGHAFLLVPVITAAALGRRRRGWRRVALPAAAIGAGMALALGLWAARNDAKLGAPVPVATNGGINLLLGNNPNARGGRADPPGGVPQTGDEIRDETLAREQALAFIRAEPGRFLASLPLKAARLWAFGPALTYRHETTEKWGRAPSAIAAAAAEGAHLVVLLVALLLGRRWVREGIPGGGRLAALVLGVAVVWTAGHLPFLGGARYLFPIQPFLVMAAVGAWSARRGVTDSGA